MAMGETPMLRKKTMVLKVKRHANAGWEYMVKGKSPSGFDIPQHAKSESLMRDVSRQTLVAADWLITNIHRRSAGG
jgi:hypothetical protein